MKRIEDCKVHRYIWLNADNYILELEAPSTLPVILPGNFAELRVNNSSSVFLRRPFSILDVNYSENTIRFYIKIIGNGTRMLGQMRIGDDVNIIFPLGNAFTTHGSKKALIIGGGSGIAPFILLARELAKSNTAMTFILGGKNKGDIFLIDQFSSFGKVLFTTEDGSLGEKGLVTEHSLFKNGLTAFDQVYTCGPEPMMKAVAEITRSSDIPCEASIENTMGCGFGVCLSCVVATNEGYKCVCTEGPVFNVNELAW
ncbi:MAG: dihydroorotate dehydrogenase electron transfer subunit [Bacteroidetes bacterium]|nr:dihydroorotate dehydrogenase electron transfer subunit [Bacteroidota bacterium]